MVFCQQCGAENSDNSPFCSNCGLKLTNISSEQQTVSSPTPPVQSPQVPNIIIQQTTAQTASQQQPAYPTYGPRYVGPPSQKSRTVALILCLVGWIGFAGFHEFYAGRIGWGLLFFFTFGFFFIGTLIHTISILTGNYRDIQGAPITNW